MRSRWRLGLWVFPLTLAACSTCDDGGGNGGSGTTELRGTQVSFNIPDGRARALLFNGSEADTCDLGRTVTGMSNPLSLGNGRWDGRCASQELVAFAPRFLPSRTVQATTLPSRVELLAPETVRVKYWIVRPQSNEVGWIRALITAYVADANAVFDALAAGVVLDYADGSVGVIDDAGEAARIGKGCSRAWWVAGDPPPTSSTGILATDAPQVPAPPGLYDPGRLNVFFVDLVEFVSFAVNCKGAPTGARPEIIYVSYAKERGMTAALFAHEVGHALGSPDWGHTENLAGFGEPVRRYNLMYSSVQDITDLTLGQIYRIHFDADAWRKWRPQVGQSTAPPDGQQLPSCRGGNDRSLPCPRLALRPQQPWP